MTIAMSKNLTKMITTLSHATIELSSTAEQIRSICLQANISL
ncbi:hypothetical protein [Shewanella gelidimarina]|nr:hypothetical protein [Shewanella gelidimarina]